MNIRTLNKLSVIFSFVFCTGYSYADDCIVNSNNLICAPNANYNPADHNNKELWDYDNVSLSTTKNNQGALVIYSYSKNFKNVSLTTTGRDSDGIHQYNWDPVNTFDNVVIKVSGLSSDGINLGRDATKSVIEIKGTLNVLSEKGHGIRVAPSVHPDSSIGEGIEQQNRLVHLLKINGNTSIETKANGDFNQGHAVFAATDSFGCGVIFACRSGGSGAVIELLGNINDIKTSGNNAAGIKASGRGYIKANNLSITSTGNNAYGIHAERVKKIVYVDKNTDLFEQDFSGRINLIGNVTINMLGKDSYALYANSFDQFGKDSLGLVASIKSYKPDNDVDYIDEGSGKIVENGIYKINGNMKAVNSGLIDIYMANGSVFKGNSNIDSNGQIHLNITGDQSIWNLTDSSSLSRLTLNDGATFNAAYTGNNTISINGDIYNKSGVINLAHDQALSDQSKLVTLTMNGNYLGGLSSSLILNTILGDDSSVTDKLIITENASGRTELKLNNIGGLGAQTINGIHVIQTGSSEENTFFIANGGYVTAGAYDYGLNLKKAGTTTNTTAFDNWYLESHLTDDTPIYTPDVGEYLAVETMGNTLFTSRLEDREGASQYQNLGNKNEGNVWVRAYGNHNKFNSLEGTLQTKGSSFVTQIGTGLVTLGEQDQYNLGAMGGIAYYDGKTRSNLTDRESKTKMNGYSLGLYGTWYAHPVEKRGAYIDSWVLWNKFKNKIDTPDQNRYKYDSSGVTASIEIGGDYLLNKNGKKDWWIQPQAQLIYQGVHADDFKDAQGVDVYHGKDNLQARMGVKTYLNVPTNGNKLTSYRPYVALNFIHNTNPYSVVINNVRYESEGSANLGELKLGIEGQVTKNSQVWLNASYVAGSHSNQAYQGNIGWKYNF